MTLYGCASFAQQRVMAYGKCGPVMRVAAGPLGQGRRPKAIYIVGGWPTNAWKTVHHFISLIAYTMGAIAYLAYYAPTYFAIISFAVGICLQ
jgi:hypothetical protein